MKMQKKTNNLSLSAIAILLILVMIGGFTFARTVRKEIIYIRDSEKDVKSSIKNAAMSFPADFEQLIPHERRMNTLIYYATGIFNSNHVIWGKEDWLFYASKNSGDPIADYEGTNSFSSEELEEAKTRMLSFQQTLQDQGIAFCLLIPPNKENVYAQYMPDKYIHSEQSRTDILAEYLLYNGVNCVNPKEPLMNCDKAFRTYFKLDTHWNELGAYIGTKAVLKTFGIELPELTDDAIEVGESTVFDLADMVGLTSVFPEDYGFRMSYTASNTDKMTKENIGEITHWHNDSAETDGCLLLVGDSFRNAMIPVLRTTFGDVYVVHRDYYQTELLREIRPDFFILEIVERHSDAFVDFNAG